MTKYRKKLIEVALPLDAINKESAREKSIRHGHPSTLHLWWARRPLAACRAVLFSSLVNDPEDDPMYGIDKDVAYSERAKLFTLIEELVKWENSNNSRVINAARLEIARSIAANKVADKELQDDTPLVANAPKLPDDRAKYLPDPPPEYTPHDVRFKMPSLRPEQVNHFLAHYAPPVLDPFAGGGSIPLEAQRLGLRAYASDLNPVPVLINKALIEIPPKFAGMPPVNPNANKGKLKTKVWHGAEGLADDVRYYGKWMRDEAEKRIGHLYPKVNVTEEMAADRPDLKPYVGKELTVIAWLWARTVKCSNPSCRARMPMVRSFWLSKKKGATAFVDAAVDNSSKTLGFVVRTNGEPPRHTSDRTSARCVFCETTIKKAQLREVASEHGLEELPFAIVASAGRSRLYLNANSQPILQVDKPDLESIQQNMTDDKRWFSPPLYGLPSFADLFTARQLTMVSTFADLVSEARSKVQRDLENTNDPRQYSGYGNAVSIYLSEAVSKLTCFHNTLSYWRVGEGKSASGMGRQALAMTWDFSELNPFANAGGEFEEIVCKAAPTVISSLPAAAYAIVEQRDARLDYRVHSPFVCTDPPYYDNIGYADLSDYFYVWLRYMLRGQEPTLFSTLLSPKADELIASAHRHDGNRQKARDFFEKGLSSAIDRMRHGADQALPVCIFYAFKQSESDEEGGTSSTGWETFLTGVISTGLLLPERGQSVPKMRRASSPKLGVA